MQKTRNYIQLIGYLGNDPVIRTTGDKTFATFSIATSEYRKGEEKKTDRVVTWHDIVLWGKQVEDFAGAFIQGSHVLIDGKIVYREYTDKNGTKHRVAEVKAEKIMNLDR